MHTDTHTLFFLGDLDGQSDLGTMNQNAEKKKTKTATTTTKNKPKNPKTKYREDSMVSFLYLQVVFLPVHYYFAMK